MAAEGLTPERKSLIHPHFSYTDIIYDACSQLNKNKLQVHQNTALRMVKNVEPRFPTAQLQEQTGVKWLDVERQERCCIEAFKALNNLSSSNVNSLSVAHNSARVTRFNNLVTFNPPFNRTKFGDLNFPNRCNMYWKLLPAEVTSLDKLSTFKSNLKRGDYFPHHWYICIYCIWLWLLLHFHFCFIVLYGCRNRWTQYMISIMVSPSVLPIATMLKGNKDFWIWIWIWDHSRQRSRDCWLSRRLAQLDMVSGLLPI